MKDAQVMGEGKATQVTVRGEAIDSMKTQRIPDLTSHTKIHANQITDLEAASRTY